MSGIGGRKEERGGVSGASRKGDDYHWERDLLVVNTHLTYPHHQWDIALRLKQIKVLHRRIDEYVRKHSLGKW